MSMWLFANLVQTGMLLAGVTLLLLVLFRRIYRHQGHRQAGGKRVQADRMEFQLPADSRQRDAQRSLSDAPPEVLEWQVEMHETARELKAELDSKTRVLQLLIGQARREADRLEQILDQLELREQGRDCSSVAKETSPNAERRARILELADRGCTSREIAQQIDASVADVESALTQRGPEGSI
ncbi:MAG: hypothetical protein ACODAD_15590 [Planctomycetota bacterium]